jgi:hypothetical protein
MDAATILVVVGLVLGLTATLTAIQTVRIE